MTDDAGKLSPALSGDPIASAKPTAKPAPESPAADAPPPSPFATPDSAAHRPLPAAPIRHELQFTETGVAAIVQQVRDEADHAMLEMLDHAIEAQQRMLKEAEEYHRKVDPVRKADVQHATEAHQQRQRQADEAGQRAAEERRSAP